MHLGFSLSERHKSINLYQKMSYHNQVILHVVKFGFPSFLFSSGVLSLYSSVFHDIFIAQYLVNEAWIVSRYEAIERKKNRIHWKTPATVVDVD